MERSVVCTGTTALAALVALCSLASAAWAQSGPAAGKAAAPQAQRKALSLRQVKVTEKAKKYYVAVWGVDKLKVSYTSSGNLIRFSYRVADPECDLNYVPNAPLTTRIRAAISNSFGFGGHNDCLLVREVDR